MQKEIFVRLTEGQITFLFQFISKKIFTLVLIPFFLFQQMYSGEHEKTLWDIRVIGKFSVNVDLVLFYFC